MSREFKISGQRLGKSEAMRLLLREEIRIAPRLSVLTCSPLGRQAQYYEHGQLVKFEWHPERGVTGKSAAQVVTDDPEADQER